MSFSKFAELCNHCHKPILAHFHFPKKILCFYLWLLPVPTPARGKHLPCCRFSCAGHLIQTVRRGLWDWLLPPSVYFPGSSVLQLVPVLCSFTLPVRRCVPSPVASKQVWLDHLLLRYTRESSLRCTKFETPVPHPGRGVK